MESPAVEEEIPLKNESKADINDWSFLSVTLSLPGTLPQIQPRDTTGGNIKMT